VRVRRSILPIILALAIFAIRSFARQSPQSSPPQVHLTAEQDHQRILDQLHITEIRPAANGAPNATDHLPNYD